MIPSLLAELTKLYKRPGLWVLVAVWMALNLVFSYLFPYFGYSGSPSASDDAAARQAMLAGALPDALVAGAIRGYPLFAGALAILIGVLSAGSEYAWNTPKVLFTMGPGRVTVLVGKLLGLLTVIAGIVLLNFGLDATAAVLVAGAADVPVQWPSTGDLAIGFGAGVLMVGTWSVLGAFLGIAFRNTAVAAGTGVVWVLAVENLLRVFAPFLGPLELIARYLPGSSSGSVAAALGVAPQDADGGMPGVTNGLDGSVAALVVAGYLLVFAVAAIGLVRRRDVT